MNGVMAISFVYLAYRFTYQIISFFRHWYVDGGRAFIRVFLESLERMDRSFAVAVTARHFFAPLYGDYSIVGRILGVVFRSFRILIGSIVYVGWTIFFAAIMLFWFAIPIAIVAAALGHIPSSAEAMESIPSPMFYQ